MADPKFMPTEEPEQKPAPQGAAGPSGPQAFAVRGDRDDEIKRQEMIDASEVTEVTAEEQAEYEDWVSRNIAMISDSRVPEGLEDAQSPSDAVLKVMSNSSFSVPQALSEGAVSTMMILHDAAKRAGKEYSPDVMFHGADEVIAALYMLGAAAGIFEGASDYAKGGSIQAPAPQPGSNGDVAMPPQEGAVPVQEAPDAKPRFMEPPASAPMPAEEAPMPMAEAEVDGDFTDEEYAMMGEALMLSVELFGKRLLDSGQLTEDTRKEAEAFWQQQIAKEVETGQTEGMAFDDMDLDAIRNQITKGGV